MSIRQAAEKSQQTGFTIVELMVATTVFSVVLLVIASGLISMSNNYYKGVNASSTQNTAATVLNTVTQAMQLSSDPYGIDADTSGHNLHTICVGNQEYMFVPGTLVSKEQAPSLTNIGVYEIQLNTSSCESADQIVASFPTNGQELLSDNMRLLKFSLGPTTPDGTGCITGTSVVSHSVCKVAITVGFGNGDDLFCDASADGGTGGCLAGDAGFDVALPAWIQDTTNHPNADIRCKTQTASNYCDVSALQTVVQRRL